ncbi:MAG: glutathione S-transferase family protein [Halieaceae bacterium]|jgi:glutathione S-transferase|nr:glutathione S-transferase family protein [Halieaceae bacterium]
MSKPVLVIGNKNYSSWSLRGWLALRKAGVDFEEEWLPLDTEEFAERICSLSPTGRVPALREGDQVVWDSLAIGEYVNERWAAGRLLPEDLELRAQARAVMAEMHSGFSELRARMPMNCRAEQRQIPIDGTLQADIDRICSLWSTCLARHGGPWLFGDFSLADAMYAPVAIRFSNYQVELPEPVLAYMGTVLSDPDVVAWMEAGRAEPEIVEADEAGV